MNLHIENNLYGLIGYPLSHSFSQRYFTGKFAAEGREGYAYKNFPLGNIGELRALLKREPDLRGFNVTIPYKEQIIPYIDELSGVAAETGAVNTVKILRNGNDVYLKGCNTDVYGFGKSLEERMTGCGAEWPERALVLGTGGASKAVANALSRLHVETNLVSRRSAEHVYKTYDQLTGGDISAHPLIVNTSPAGMYPDIDNRPDIPYRYITKKHFLYDLIYNPEETGFMRAGRERGAAVCNGERMLYLQADKAWEIWQGNEV